MMHDKKAKMMAGGGKMTKMAAGGGMMKKGYAAGGAMPMKTDPKTGEAETCFFK
jgi:hypothetical protein